MVSLALVSQAEGCEALQKGQLGTVIEVVDGDTLLLDDGSKVRMIGIQAPKLALGRNGFEDWPLADEAKRALADITLGAEVRLAFGDERMDRHGRVLAHVFVNSSPEIWAQQYMLKEGMARVYSFADNRFCLDELLKAESVARAENKGIWAHDYYQLRYADRPKDLLTHIDDYELVEGRILSAKKAGSRIYLNFGRDWKEDFTIVIEKAGLRTFEKSGIDPLDYEGARVRVRGWIEMRDGPRINVTHPEQIEILATK